MKTHQVERIVIYPWGENFDNNLLDILQQVSPKSEVLWTLAVRHDQDQIPHSARIVTPE
jgi:hypothetical protein